MRDIVDVFIACRKRRRFAAIDHQVRSVPVHGNLIERFILLHVDHSRVCIELMQILARGKTGLPQAQNYCFAF
ncbi:MAG: hypothetical protein GY785_14760 [Gammaproteobacteria bacterium]|nr:hypothetical protein [Gammaproteobacteria bacterium]MCP4981291.1 hypothetical protein [Gammaproteobacteria bacterium]